MKRIAWPSVAISVLLAVAASAATRPHYGGVLRMAMQGAPLSLDPRDPTSDEYTRACILSLISDTLARVDERGVVRPGIASHWESSDSNRSWRFQLRSNATFADGQAVTPEAVAASLRAVHRDWRVDAFSDALIILVEQPAPHLPEELTLAENSILRRDPAGSLIGTGPFSISEWQPGKRVTLKAVENFWRGRTFLDGIEIELGKSSRDQAIAFDLGKLDVAELPAEQMRRAISEGRHMAESPAAYLVALVFSQDAASDTERRNRLILSRAIDRNSIRGVLFQSHAEAANSLLPNAMTGYAFLMEEAAKKSEQATRASWTLGFASGDPLNRVLAERIALNARDAGITLQLAPGGSAADVKLMQLPLVSSDPFVALSKLAAAGRLTLSVRSNSLEDLYQAEQEAIASGRIIPLLHVPRAWVLIPALHDWTASPHDLRQVEDVWLEGGKH